MPKMKSKSGAKKRFIATGSGQWKRGTKGRRHILTNKSTKRKRHLRSFAAVHESDAHRITAMLPNH